MSSPMYVYTVLFRVKRRFRKAEYHTVNVMGYGQDEAIATARRMGLEKAYMVAAYREEDNV